MNSAIKYVVFNTATRKYYAAGSYKCSADLNMAKLYLRKSDAQYRARVLGPYRQPERNTHVVVKVKVTLVVLNDQ